MPAFNLSQSLYLGILALRNDLCIILCEVLTPMAIALIRPGAVASRNPPSSTHLPWLAYEGFPAGCWLSLWLQSHFLATLFTKGHLHFDCSGII